MSAFAFINQNKSSTHSSVNGSSNSASDSPPLSPYLIEELYDSQQLNTFVNQSRTFSSPPDHQQSTTLFSAPQDTFFHTSSPPSSSSSIKKKKKNINSKAQQPISSYFSFIDDLEDPPQHQSATQKNGNAYSVFQLSGSHSSSRDLSPSQQNKSAFAFIGQSTPSLSQPAAKLSASSNNYSSVRESTLSPTSWSTTTNTGSPSRSRRNVIKPNNEMKLISANSSYHRLQTEKTNELNTLSRLYTKQLAVYDQITTLKSKIHLVQQQKDTALAKEDFLIAETLHHQEQKMTTSLEELGSNTALQKQIHTVWQRIAQLEEKEAELAQEVVTCCEQVKEERTTSFDKLVNDRERIHQQKLQAIGDKRTQLESEKSEVAFDLGIWEQSNQDLTEREEDAVHEETVKKRALVAQGELVTSEIDELKAKLKALELERQSLMNNIAALEITVQEKLWPFKEERREHEQEFQQIEQRRKEIEQKASQLDQQATQVNTEMTQHEEEKQRNLKELQDLEDQISSMSSKTTNTLSVTSVLKELQDRDSMNAQHKSELQRSRENISHKKKLIDSIHFQIYAQQQKHIQLDETVNEMQQKLKSLGRQKQLAIDAGRFQNAAAWTNQIKVLEKDLQQLKESQQIQNSNGDKDAMNEELEREQEELSGLEQEYADIEKRKNMEIKSLLEKSKEDLEKRQQQFPADDDKVDTAFKSLIENELKLIGVQLDVLYQQEDLVTFQ